MRHPMPTATTTIRGPSRHVEAFVGCPNAILQGHYAEEGAQFRVARLSEIDLCSARRLTDLRLSCRRESAPGAPSGQ